MPLFFQSEIFPKAPQTLWLQSKIWGFARVPLQSTLRNGGNNGKNSGAVNDMCRYLCWVRVTDMFLQNQSFLPADFNFFWAEDEISNNQGLAGCIRRDLYFLPPRPSSSPSALNHSQPSRVSGIFLSLFSHLPPPNPLESPEIKDFRGMSIFLFRVEEVGSGFWDVFLGDFSGV